MMTFHHFVVLTMMIVFSYMGLRMFRRAVASQELQVLLPACPTMCAAP